MVAGSFAGCAREPSPVGEESAAPAVDQSALDPAMADAFRRGANQQSKTIRGTTIVVHRACIGIRRGTDRGKQWVGVDFELQPLGESFQGLDLRAIEARDGTTGDPLGSATLVQRLTDDAHPADDSDPVFAGANKFRGLLVYQVPRNVRTVTLYYDGEPLHANPLPLGHCHVWLPEPRAEVVAMAKRDTDSPAYSGYLLEIECHHWSRMATPRSLVLRCLANDNATLADPDRFIELDDQGQPLESSPANKPLYPDLRRFLVEFWCPRDAVPVDLVAGDEKIHLPTTSTASFSQAALEALAVAPRLQHARHRRE
jgi:hypothetical protein